MRIQIEHNINKQIEVFQFDEYDYPKYAEYVKTKKILCYGMACDYCPFFNEDSYNGCDISQRFNDTIPSNIKTIILPEQLKLFD